MASLDDLFGDSTENAAAGQSADRIRPTEHPRIVIIGAGQAGLAIAYFLRRFELVPGQDFVMLDRSATSGGAWQHRWSTMKLGQAHKVNDLPGMDAIGLSFTTANPERSARDVVSEYYGRYEQHYNLRVRRPVHVRRVTNDGPDMLVEYEQLVRRPIAAASAPRGFLGRRRAGSAVPANPTETVVHGAIRTEFLINATGTWGAPFVPYYPGQHSFGGRQLHAVDFTTPEDFRGARVVVVGGGTTAVEFLLDLEPVAAELTWATRRPVDWVDREVPDLEFSSELVEMQDRAARGGEALPSVVKGTGVPLTERVRAAIGRGLLVERPMFERIATDRVVWSDDRWAPADVIIWATGFRPDLRHLSPLGLRGKLGGMVVAQGVALQDSRVFLAGYGPQASTSGANRSGRMIARQLIAML